MGCQVEIADKIVAHKADYLLPLKGNQPTLEADVEDYFRTAPADELVSKTTVEKGHGRIETRTYTASSKVDWITSERSYPGQPRFKNINTVAKVHARAEYADRARLALLLRHFSELKDNREPWRIVYPLQEVLLLVTCATIASCDDFDDIVAWGKHHLVFLRHFSEFHHGIPCERWLRALLNRIDPILFGR